MQLYTGYKTIPSNDEQLAEYYQGHPVGLDVLENEYVIVKDEEGNVVDKFVYQNGFLKQVKYSTITSMLDGVIKPRNLEQELAFHMLKDETSKIKVLTGRYGSGKSMSMIAEAVSLLEKGKVEKIVYVRNNINVKNTVELGALPGEANQKLWPYLMVLADHLGGEFILEKYIQEGKIEPVHLGFLRGRDLRNSLIYCTEAQNLSIDHIKLLIGRIGEGSQLWLDGDFGAQVDRDAFAGEKNGLQRAIERLKGEELFAYVHLNKSERSAAAALADKLD